MKNKLREIRRFITSLGDDILVLKREAVTYPDYITQTDPELRGEVMANLTLAFRHVEYARMRLGKAIQALDGGVSVYKD